MRNLGSSLCGMALMSCALLSSGAANAWNQTVGRPTPPNCDILPCTNQTATLSGGRVGLTAETFVNTVTSQGHQTNIYTYQFDLTNISDARGLTAFGIDFGQAPLPGDLEYYIGTQRYDASDVYHLSAIGHGGSAVEDNSEDGDLGGSYAHYAGSWKAKTGSAPNQDQFVSFQSVNHQSILEGGSLSSEFVFQHANSSAFHGNTEGDSRFLHEYFYLQTAASLRNDSFYVSDGSQIAQFHCQPTPEPGAPAALALGGLGVALLGLRARRVEAA